MYQHILIPVDNSPISLSVVQEAARFAKMCPDAKIRLIHVINLAEATTEAIVYSTVQHEEKREEQVRNAGQKVIDAALTAAKNAGFEPEARIKEVWNQDTAEVILREAEKWGADIILMGTHGYGGLQHLLLGSVAEGVLRHTHVPLLLVRAQASK